jgi:hypothetical protein
MDLILKILAGLFALLFIVMGAGFMLDPLGNAANLAVTPLGEHGLNSLRGDLGGLFLASAALIVLGIFQRKGEWLFAVAVLMLFIAAGRLIGFAVDGNPAQATLVAFGFEIVIAAVLIFTGRRMAAGAG